MELEHRLKVGARLRSLREGKRLTQEELAYLCGVSRKTVQRWERGESLPEAEVFATLMVTFQVNFRWLIGLGKVPTFINAEHLDSSLWEVWQRLGPAQRAALKEMARFLETEQAALKV